MIGQAMMIFRVRVGLFDDLRPVAGARVVLDADPDVRHHQLHCKQGEGCGEANSREDFHQSFVGFFVFFFIQLKG